VSKRDRLIVGAVFAALCLVVAFAGAMARGAEPVRLFQPCPVTGKACDCGCSHGAACECGPKASATIRVNVPAVNVTFTSPTGTLTLSPDSAKPTQEVVTPPFAGTAYYTVTAEAYGRSVSRTVDVRAGCLTEILVDWPAKKIAVVVREKLPVAPVVVPVQPAYQWPAFGGGCAGGSCRGR
jgi:hypothetical protein